MRFTTMRRKRDVIGELRKHARVPTRSIRVVVIVMVVVLALEEV